MDAPTDSKLAAVLFTSMGTLIPLAPARGSTDSCNWRSLDVGPILADGVLATVMVLGMTTMEWSMPLEQSRPHPALAGQALWLPLIAHNTGRLTSGHPAP